MASNQEGLAVGALVITQGIGLYTTFLPALTDVNSGNPSDPQFADDVRLGEIAAGAMTLCIGIVLSYYLNNHVPILLAGIVTVGMVMVYEHALRSTPNV